MNRIKTAGRFIIPGFLIALALEIFVFNFAFFSSRGEHEVLIPLDKCIYQGQKDITADGGIILGCGENGSFVQFDCINVVQKVKNIALKVSCTDGDESWWGYMREPYAFLSSPAVRVSVLMEGKDFEKVVLRERLLYGRGEREIINLPDRENATRITLQLSGLKGSELKLEEICLNPAVPMRLVPLRIVTVIFFILFICLFRPGSVLWKESLLTENGKLRRKYMITAITVLLLLSVITPIMISKNRVYMQSENSFHPYTDLARALAKGQLYLELEPSQELLSMENPYDPVAREDKQVRFQLDYAYYEGRYYIYFGVIPCLLLYLPWYMVTGTDIPGIVAMTVMLLICYSAVWLLIRRIILRYRKDLPAAVGILAWLGAVSVFSLPAVMGDANNYFAPMLAAVDFFMAGMSSTLAAADAFDEGNTKKGRGLLFTGSLFMAFIAGCRPQLVLGAACTLPVIAGILLKKDDKGRIRPEILNLTVFAVPYIVVAAGLMLYNALRFGSPFDFGAMKNLTFAFLDKAGFNITAAGAGIYYYLFRLPALTGFYPYLGRSTFMWSNPNMLASHPSTGGILFLYPVVLISLACMIRTKDRYGRELKWIGISSMLLVPLLAAITATMGGLMDRYRMDIAPFAALSLICGMISLYSVKKNIGDMRSVRIVLTTFVVMAVIVSGLTYATEGLNYLQDVNPEAYMDIAKSIEFWR